jgi:hypothetical protein
MASQHCNSTWSPRRCRISSRQYTPYPISLLLLKTVRSQTILPRLDSPFSRTFAVKAGYPPRSLTAVIPELPLSSLGLAPGDQLIVNRKSGSAAPPTGVPSTAQSLPTSPRALVNPSASLSTPSSNAAQAAPAVSTTRDGGPDHVEVDGGYLVHRVRVIDWSLARCILLRVPCPVDRARR